MRKREGSTGYGYETRGGDKVTAFRDMIDGGGAGRSGDEFEGGGLFSLLANLFFSPYGSKRERAAGIIEGPTRPPGTRSTQSSDTSDTPAQQGSPNYTPPGTPVQRGAFRKYGPPGTPVQRGAFQKFGPPALTTSEKLMGSGMTPENNYVPYYGPPGTASEKLMGSGMTPLNAYVDPMQRFAEDLIEMYGPETANMILNSGIADQAYQSYVQRGYRF